ncbi:hypothetical protein KAR91_05310 [Candidatus Pacearchaeota archaeon]|nr:hypothetical protein [Candidatus Pacearchaeota archaeon]
MHKIAGAEYVLNGDDMPQGCIPKEYEFEIEYRVNGDVVFFLHGGPTGYESFHVDKKVIGRMMDRGWYACGGTPGRFNQLRFTAEQMRDAFKQANLLRNQLWYTNQSSFQLHTLPVKTTLTGS